MNIASALRTCRSYFDPAAPIEPIANDQEVKRLYRYWRLRIFYSMYLGYVFYYLTRKSFTFAMPALKADLGFGTDEIGLLSSVFSLTYGISKFASGMVGDRSNPRTFMAFGLILTGIWNICFGFSSSLAAFVLFWALNAWFQGFGWPGCARSLTHWYGQSERGRWWGVWNTSHNIGGAIIPLIAGGLAEHYGWRSALYVPGLLCIAFGFVLLNRLRDTPQSLGLPAIEVFRRELDLPASQPIGGQQVASVERELTTREILFQHVLSNPFIWFLGLSYFFVYLVRTAINEWSVLYLVEEKGYSALGASQVVVWFEIGGFFGSLISGWCSDWVFKGRRGPVNLLFMLFTLLTTLAFWKSPMHSYGFDASMMFLFGFFIFGPQMLIGIAAAELSHKKAAATATGFTGTIAYLGAAAAGYPLGYLLQQYGWSHYFMTLVACSTASVIILMPFWKIRSKPV